MTIRRHAAMPVETRALYFWRNWRERFTVAISEFRRLQGRVDQCLIAQMRLHIAGKAEISESLSDDVSAMRQRPRRTACQRGRTRKGDVAKLGFLLQREAHSCEKTRVGAKRCFAGGLLDRSRDQM